MKDNFFNMRTEDGEKEEWKKLSDEAGHSSLSGFFRWLIKQWKRKNK